MKPRIVFVVMSAVAKVGTVDQLARALAPHTALVHHDFSQTPHFPLRQPNVMFVPEPKRTGWAVFGFVEGIFHAMRYALDHLEFDYLQVLSPTCFPIKSMAQFESHVSGEHEAHFECVDLLADQDALMTVGYRAFTPEHSMRHRVLRKLSRIYFGEFPGRRDEAGIWLRSGFATNRNGGMSAMARLALTAVKAVSDPSIGRHLFDEGFRPYYGTDWIGARRHVIKGMVEGFERPGVRDYFSRLRIAEEFLVPSLLKQLGPRTGPMNHVVQKFNEARAGVFDESHFEVLKVSSKFFARKLPDDPNAPIRLRIIEELIDVEDVHRAP